MKPKLYTTLATALALTLLLLSLTTPIYSQEVPEGSYKLTHNVRVTDHGFLAVEETIEFLNTGASTLTLQPLELNYASITIGNISSVVVQGPVDFEVGKGSVDNATKITLTPRAEYQVKSGSSTTIHIQFYASHMVDTTGEGFFSATLPLYPSMNKILDEVQSNLVLPVDANINDLPLGFKSTEEVGVKKLVGVFQNVQPRGGETQVLNYTLDAAISLPLLDFPSVKRIFKVSNDGSVTVHEEIHVVNIGVSKASKIRLTLLNEDATTVDIVPISTPPLTNRFTTSLEDKKLNLWEAYHVSLSKGEELLFGIEYPLSSEYSTSVDGDVSFEVPLKPPIDGVVWQFTNLVEAESGVDVSGGASVVYEGATPFNTELYGFRVSLWMAWASDEVMPFATLLFVVVLVSLLMGRTQFRRAVEVEKEVPSVEEFVAIIEEKTGAVDGTLQSFRSRRRGEIPRSSFAEARRYFETLKGRAAGKIGEIRSKLISAKPYLKERLSELSNVDREYNRAVLDVINLYEQYHMGRIREETFERLRGKYQKRLDKAKERLNESVEGIHSEVEK